MANGKCRESLAGEAGKGGGSSPIGRSQLESFRPSRFRRLAIFCFLLSGELTATTLRQDILELLSRIT